MAKKRESALNSSILEGGGGLDEGKKKKKSGSSVGRKKSAKKERAKARKEEKDREKEEALEAFLFGDLNVPHGEGDFEGERNVDDDHDDGAHDDDDDDDYDEQGSLKPAWVDDDDDDDDNDNGGDDGESRVIGVSLNSQSRFKKLRLSQGEDVVSIKEFDRRIRERVKERNDKLGKSFTSWASIDDGGNANKEAKGPSRSVKDMLQSTAPLFEEGETLLKEEINAVRLPDANQDEPSNCEFCFSELELNVKGCSISICISIQQIFFPLRFCCYCCYRCFFFLLFPRPMHRFLIQKPTTMQPR